MSWFSPSIPLSGHPTFPLPFKFMSFFFFFNSHLNPCLGFLPQSPYPIIPHSHFHFFPWIFHLQLVSHPWFNRQLPIFFITDFFFQISKFKKKKLTPKTLSNQATNFYYKRRLQYINQNSKQKFFAYLKTEKEVSFQWIALVLICYRI